MKNKLQEAILYFDGGIRQGLMAYGWILLDYNDQTSILASGNRTCGLGSSNIAEYRALIAGLQGSIRHNIDIIHIMGDSQLIIKQVTGAFQAKKSELIQHRNCVLELLNQFKSYTIKWIPRQQNKRADALVNEVFQRRKNKCSTQKSKRKS